MFEEEEHPSNTPPSLSYCWQTIVCFFGFRRRLLLLTCCPTCILLQVSTVSFFLFERAFHSMISLALLLLRLRHRNHWRFGQVFPVVSFDLHDSTWDFPSIVCHTKKKLNSLMKKKDATLSQRHLSSFSQKTKNLKISYFKKTKPSQRRNNSTLKTEKTIPRTKRTQLPLFVKNEKLNSHHERKKKTTSVGKKLHCLKERNNLNSLTKNKLTQEKNPTISSERSNANSLKINRQKNSLSKKNLSQEKTHLSPEEKETQLSQENTHNFLSLSCEKKINSLSREGQNLTLSINSTHKKE